MHSKNHTPIFDKLIEFAQRQGARFHVPGHKGGFFFHQAGREVFTPLLAIDYTELTGLDDLHDPESIIHEAQRKAATCFFADKTYFLINGSTVGNLAMILGMIQKGDQVLIQRNSHKSIFHGLALAEAEAIFIEPEVCPSFEVPIGITLESVHEALDRYPEAKALLLTYPNYYGMALELGPIIEYAHQKGLLVLIDEAHGAHFGQHSQLPPSAMQLGADVAVQSTHKMVGSMTMTSMLHMQGERVQQKDIEYYLHSLQSSSPSYPLMASLDLARAQLESLTEEEWETAIKAYQELRESIRSLGYKVSGNRPEKINNLKSLEQGQSLGILWDPYKLIIQASWITGFELKNFLEEEQIYVELADPLNVLLTLPLQVQQDWNQRLLQALQKQAQNQRQRSTPLFDEKNHLEKSRTKPAWTSINMRVIRAAEKKEVPLQEAIGERAAEMLIPYPPGIPILLEGEIITEEHIQHLVYLQKEGAYFQGKSKEFTTIQVIK